MLPFTKDELAKAVEDGLVTARRHPSLPYTIYNYSPEVQYSNRWNDITLNCRGLILDKDFNIIARPWKKFFNLGQVDLPIQFDTPVEVMDKVDGSLGILYPIVHPDGLDVYWGVATRGSFESPQAIEATKLYAEKYGNFDPLPEYTMLFEIVLPWNRIVLDYGDTEDLVLLGAVNNETGYYISPTVARYLWTQRGFVTPQPAAWPGPVVEVMPYKSIGEALSYTDRPNAEGFVIRSHNFMVKLKQADYLSLHKLVTNASPKTVWEQLKAGKSKSEIVSAFPDEFHEYVESMIDPLVEAYESRLQEILADYSMAVARVEDKARAGEGMDFPERKAYALEFKKSKNAKYFFSLLDGRGISEILWSELRPREIKDEE